MNDYLIKAMVYDGKVRAYGAVSTESVEEARRRQDTWPTASAALGRAMTLTGLMGAMYKGDNSINVKIIGDGPLRSVITDGNASGEVRGYVTEPHVDFPLNDAGKLDVKRAVGTEGTFSVVKDLGLKDYFTGQVPIISGEIGEDFTYYFANSEQIPSAAGAGVLVNPDYSVEAAGGFIVQVMPEADEEAIASLEEEIQAFPPISSLLREGKTPEEMIQQFFPGENVQFLEKLPLSFRCQCSKERLASAIAGLGNEEIDAMIEEDNGAEATCHFCNEKYIFSVEELNNLKSSNT